VKGTRNKRALLSGASSGIGFATAKTLIEEGWDLAIVARRPAPLENLRVFGSVNGSSVIPLPCDLSDRSEHDRMLDELLARWESLDAVILNAGVSGRTPLDDPDLRAFDRVVELDLVSPLRTLRTLVPKIAEGGRIVVIGSVLGRFGVPDLHGYCAAKAGVMGMVRSLALDLAPRRIAVNAVLPGWVRTEMARSNIAEQAPKLGLEAEEATRHFLAQVPLGRFLEPGEIAHQVRHLLSESSAGITGQAINVCSGVMA
jgi:3-hydroxybutyrate dehydrogenase